GAVGVGGGKGPVRGEGGGDKPCLGGLPIGLPLTHEIRPTPARVPVGVAIAIRWRERQAALPGVDGIRLPAAQEQSDDAACVTEIPAALAEGQLPETVEAEDVIAMIVIP